MRLITWQARGVLLALLAVVLCGLPSARADWSDSFNGGAFEQFWQFGSDGGDAGTFLGGQIIDDQLVLTASATPGDGGAQTGFGVVLTETFSDIRMSGVINPGNNGDINDSVGLLIHGNLVNQSFYMAEVNYSSGELIIYRNNPGVDGGNSNLATEPIPNLQFTQSVYVEIQAVQGQIDVAAYTDATKDTLRATVSFNDTSDAALSSGLAGVLVNENFGALPMLGVWDDLVAISLADPTGPGDWNGDGNVDGADLIGYQQDFGDTATAQDFVDWESNLGATSPAVAAIPEPSTLVLASVLLAAYCAFVTADSTLFRNRTRSCVLAAATDLRS